MDNDSDVIGLGNDKDFEESSPPSTPTQLMKKIQDDYQLQNYLWTGNIYTTAFEDQCRFTDPTLSFIGTEKFVSNVKNLQPILSFLTYDLRGIESLPTESGSADDSEVNIISPYSQCKSDLLDISINEEEQYVQTRWKMIGTLGKLPWKPTINVIGRTKFWYRSTNAGKSTDDDSADDSLEGYKVYFYDEQWEIPANKALLQLITPS